MRDSHLDRHMAGKLRRRGSPARPERAWIPLLLLALAASPVVLAAGDRELGRHLSAECATCHRESAGRSGAIPVIAAIPAAQFIALMSAYREGQRDNAVMRTIAGRLSTDEIAALAAYYETLQRAP